MNEMQSDRRGRDERGYSLAELMVSVAMLAMIVLASLPNLAGAMRRSRVDDAGRQILSTLQKARASAVNAGSDYVVTFLASGWNVFDDADQDGVRDSNEAWVFATPLQLGQLVSWQQPPGTTVVSNVATSGCQCLRWSALGLARVGSSTTQAQAIFLGDGKNWRRITVSTGGATKIERWVPGASQWVAY